MEPLTFMTIYSPTEFTTHQDHKCVNFKTLEWILFHWIEFPGKSVGLKSSDTGYRGHLKRFFIQKKVTRNWTDSEYIFFDKGYYKWTKNPPEGENIFIIYILDVRKHKDEIRFFLKSSRKKSSAEKKKEKRLIWISP